MRSALAALFSAVCLVSASTSHAQIKRDTDHILARLSYSNTLMQYSADRARSVCIAVYDSGMYRFWRPDTTKMQPGDPNPYRVVSQGMLTDSELHEFSSMLDELNFKFQPPGIIEQGAESFLAEVVRHGKTVRYRWLDPDRRHPFPKGVDKLVSWLQVFQPKDSTRITLYPLSDMKVCPAANENPLPLFALNATGSANVR